MKDPWVLSATDSELSTEKHKDFNARRKFKAGKILSSAVSKELYESSVSVFVSEMFLLSLSLFACVLVFSAIGKVQLIQAMSKVSKQ